MTLAAEAGPPVPRKSKIMQLEVTAGAIRWRASLQTCRQVDSDPVRTQRDQAETTPGTMARTPSATSESTWHLLNSQAK